MPLDLEDLWTVAEAARRAKVSEATVRSWAHRGHLPVAKNSDGEEIRDVHGRPRFWPLDVARAEFRTRERARRHVA
jgi:excisionase family DNA binding protein